MPNGVATADDREKERTDLDGHRASTAKSYRRKTPIARLRDRGSIFRLEATSYSLLVPIPTLRAFSTPLPLKRAIPHLSVGHLVRYPVNDAGTTSYTRATGCPFLNELCCIGCRCGDAARLSTGSRTLCILKTAIYAARAIPLAADRKRPAGAASPSMAHMFTLGTCVRRHILPRRSRSAYSRDQ